MKLLIVDDHAGIRSMIRQLAALPESAVRECATGETAVGLVREFSPDVVTMDVRMPGLSGLDATRQIRDLCPTTRIVVVSAFDQPALRHAALDAGAAEFVAKDNLDQLGFVLARLGDAGKRPVADAPAVLKIRKV